MVRLEAHPEKYNGITPNRCGLLFLATPHSGASIADWNKYLVDLAELVFGVRSNAIVDNLRSFNPFSVESKEAFLSLPVVPPYFCLCETKMAKVAGNYKIVSRHANRLLTSAPSLLILPLRLYQKTLPV